MHMYDYKRKSVSIAHLEVIPWQLKIEYGIICFWG